MPHAAQDYPPRCNCPPGLKKDTMQAISAPYNFVPLDDWVHIPSWAAQVSHDWPFQDGLSGEIHYRLTAESPLLVGGRQEKNGADDRPNTEVFPCRLPDGTYAVPGASMKGLLRAVVEIIGFARLRMVDDLRPGLRDISGPHVKSYTGKVRNKVKTGFLRLRADGGQEIVPCKMARLPHALLKDALDLHGAVFRKGMTVRKKYKKWQEYCRRQGWDPEKIRFDLDDEKKNAIHLGQGAHEGFPVFTGQISDSRQKNGKKKDFVFYDEAGQAIEVPPDAWRDFLYIHGDDTDDEGMSWPGHWRERFRQGRPVPVFYLQDGAKLRIGLAYMPKLAGDYSIHDAIRHASKKHLEAPGVGHYDLADLLFGAINGESQDDALRGRVNLETALAEGDPRPVQQPDTILNGPKPTYFPNYLQQPTDASTRHLRGDKNAQYTTYIAHGDRRPRIRGHKRYPARPDGMIGVQALLPGQRNSKKVQVRLHTLPKGTAFRGRLVFHNLKPEELGALLWAMTWGGNDALRHGLGMGKPFGFGQVRFHIDAEKSRLIPNDPAQPESALDEARQKALMACFVEHMETAARKRGKKHGWADSPRLQNLLAMADPEAAGGLPRGMDLRHMCLDPENKIDEFTWAKQKDDALVLGDYHTVTRSYREQKAQEQARQRREAAERERRAAEEQERARRQAEFEALPEHEKARIAFQKQVQGFPEQGPLNKADHERLIKAVREYQKAVESAGDPEARKAAAQLIRETLERLGWVPSGLDKKKRQKREKKRIEELAAWESGKIDLAQNRP